MATSLAFAGSAAIATTASAGAQAPAKVRVAGIPLDVAATVYYALDQGFFLEQGLDVEIIPASSGAAVAPAVIGGSIDIGNGNTTVLATGHEKGLPFVLIAPSGAYVATAPTAALMVTAASPIHTAQDLAGKIVSVGSLHTVGEVAIRAWLDKSKVNADSIKFVELIGSAIAAALTAGRIDAAMTEEPWMSQILATGARKIASPYDFIAPRWIEGGYFCTVDYARSHQDVIKRFARVIARTSGWANTNPDATAKILEKYSKAPIPSGMQRTFYPDRLVASDLQPLIDASARYGLLKTAFPAKDLFASGIG